MDLADETAEDAVQMAVELFGAAPRAELACEGRGERGKAR